MSIRRLRGAMQGFRQNPAIYTMELERITSAWSFTSLSWWPIEWNSANVDPQSWWDGTNFDWTVDVSGLYLIKVNLRFASAEVAYLRLYDVDGAAEVTRNSRYGSSIGSSGFWWSFQWWLEAGNAYRVEVYTTTNAAVNAVTDSRQWVTGPIVT